MEVGPVRLGHVEAVADAQGAGGGALKGFVVSPVVHSLAAWDFRLRGIKHLTHFQTLLRDSVG
ncbi:MAG: hypothetical protein OHK005_15340 [Candidatus Methylacidiphilales bacterium]